jgi:predicted O-methyltransferase YrrM
MNMKSSLIKLINTGVRRAAKIADRAGQNRHNLGIVVSQSLQKLTSSKDLLFPLAFVELLEDCLKEITLKKIENIKTEFDPKNDVSIKRFSSLIDALRHLPPVEFSSANEIALIADSYRGNLEPIEYDQWACDVRSHFEMSSSFGTKGRILSTVVRFTQARQCLELGTAYGMSALFILEALKTRGKDTHLTTLEAFEPQFSISSKTLKSRYGNQVSCEFGLSQEALPMIVKSLERVDFLFHDAGHSREDYVRDFHTVLPILAPGAVVLIDDIRWDDPRFSGENPCCYEGWVEILNHPRVRRAVEITDSNGSMGLLQLGE